MMGFSWFTRFTTCFTSKETLKSPSQESVLSKNEPRARYGRRPGPGPGPEHSSTHGTNQLTLGHDLYSRHVSLYPASYKRYNLIQKGIFYNVDNFRPAVVLDSEKQQLIGWGPCEIELFHFYSVFQTILLVSTQKEGLDDLVVQFHDRNLELKSGYEELILAGSTEYWVLYRVAELFSFFDKDLKVRTAQSGTRKPVRIQNIALDPRYLFLGVRVTVKGLGYVEVIEDKVTQIDIRIFDQRGERSEGKQDE